MVPVLYVGGTVLSSGVRRAFGNVVRGGATVYAALSEQRGAYSVRTGEGLSNRKKSGPGFLPSVWFVYNTSGPPSRISRGLPCPAKPAGEDVTVVIRGSEGLPKVDTACWQGGYCEFNPETAGM